MTDAALLLLLRQQGRTQALNDAYDAVAKAVLTDNTGTSDDAAYNRAILDSLRAIMRCR